MAVFGVLVVLALAFVVWRYGLAQSARDQVQAMLGRGQWRPAMTVIVLMAVVAAAALTLRGQWIIGLVLLAIALWAGLFIRRDSVRDAPDGMTRAEASALLGVAADAKPEEVREAYRRLMRRAHPDTGGTQGMATQLGRARDVLLAKP